LALGFLLGFLGCDTGSTNPGHHSPEELAQAKARPAPKPAQASSQAGDVNVNGAELYSQYCAGCHAGGKNGPALEGVMGRREFPSGTPVNDARLRDTIEMGRAMMPAFKGSLTPEQVAAIIKYVHTL
jgi:mono/diheme cytochrome c family protein